nr:zinc finger, CCHC-type [Tanacetum cinerariifolium]
KTQVNLQLQVQRVRTDNGTEFKNKTLAKFFDEVGITQQFSAARTLQQNGVVEKRNQTLVETARTMLTFVNLPSFLWAEAIATACFTQNRLIIHKRFNKTPYELMNMRKPNIKFFRMLGCRCYLLNDYEDVGKLKAKGDTGVFIGYSKESAAFRIYNKRTRKIHESVNVNFDEISEMASKQFSLEPGLSNLNEMRKSSHLLVSKVSEASKKDLEDLFQKFYDEYFDSSKIMKSSTTNVETLINEEVFHEVSESFQRESSSSSLNNDVQQTSTSHNVFNERLEDAYFNASTSFHNPSNVHTYYQPYPHEKKRTKDHPLHKIIGDSKSSVRIREEVYVGQTQGSVSKQYPDHVYALDKALYGLKQSPRAWFKFKVRFRTKLLKIQVAQKKVKIAFENADSSLRVRLIPRSKLGINALALSDRHHTYHETPSDRELAELPKGVKPIRSKWVFKKKLNPCGSINAFKARLVSKGDRQREGLDYFDTYASVARISSIRTLIAISAIKGLYVHQMDVKTTFLNGYLHEEVYMKQPEGFVIQGQENKVYRLVKSLYSLKKAPKQWHERFDTTVISFGFKHNSADRCIYTKSMKDYTVVICLYVDDMLIISTTINGISETKSYLSSNFKIKDLGEVVTILGIKVKRTNDQICLSQSHYIEKILTKFQHLHIKESNVPFEPSVHLEKNSGRGVAQLEYTSVSGCLMYTTHSTRPNIAFAISKLSQYTSNPSLEQQRAVSKVLGYLKRTSALNLTYTSYPGVLEGYSDASWVNHIEFIALAAAGKEAEWMHDLLLDIQLWPGLMPSIPMYCDSQATLSKAYNSVYNRKSRHVRLRHNYVRQVIENGTISVVYVKSCRNLADPLTKPLTRDFVSVTT